MRTTTWVFIASVLVLVTVGILILATASSVRNTDAGYFVKHQLVWLVFFFLVTFVTTRVDYRLYKFFALPLSFGALALLVVVLVPGIGREINGSWRWISIGPLTIQPSELAKVSVIILFSWWLARNQRRINEWWRGIIIPFFMLGGFVVLLVLEPDFGTTMLVSVVAICMMFLSGVSWVPLASLGVIGFGGVATLIYFNPERMARIFAFLDPQKYEHDKAWQLVNSLRAFASGGWSGVGFGQSMQKYDYLPEAHTDFIFPIIGEEFGLIASILVVLLFFLVFVLGFRIALNARDDFGRFLAYGITLMVSIQALINFAVVTGLVPTKGLALPFISYGGSSLVVSGFMIGILLNIAHQSMQAPEDVSRGLFKDRVRAV
jgi:cell division protein FtsW